MFSLNQRLLVLALCGVIPIVAQERVDPVDHYLQPPFRSVDAGLKPSWNKPPEPLLEAGEAIIFFVNQAGTISQAEPCAEIRLVLGQPGASEELAATQSSGGMDLAGRSVGLQESQETGALGIAAESQGLEHAREAGRLAPVEVAHNLDSRQERGGSTTARAGRAAETASHAGGSATAKASEATESVAEAGAQNTQAQTAAVSSEQAGGGTRSRTGEHGVETVADASGLASARLSDQVRISTTRGGLATESDYRRILHVLYGGALSTRTGQEIKSLFDQADFLRGFQGGQYMDIVNDMQWVITQDEYMAFLTLLKQGGPLAKLLNRPPAAQARKDVPPGTGEPALELCFEFIPERSYHGHSVLLSAHVKNTSEATAYEPLMLIAVPKHADFLAFPQDMPAGVSLYAIEDQRLLAIKLYRPLSPGEEFALPIGLRVHPWTIGAARK